MCLSLNVLCYDFNKNQFSPLLSLNISLNIARLVICVLYHW